MLIVMNAVLDVLRHFVGKIGDYESAFVLRSRRRFVKHMAEGDTDAAVAEMESCLKRLQKARVHRRARQGDDAAGYAGGGSSAGPEGAHAVDGGGRNPSLSDRGGGLAPGVRGEG